MKKLLENITENKTTLLKQLIPFVIIVAFALFATQSWKGEAGFPATQHYDLPLHAYKMWYVADHVQHGNLFFDFDYKSNSLFARSYPILPYLVGAPFVMVGGLWNGISWSVIFCYAALGIGTYLLAREVKLKKETALVASISVLLSYTLVLETAHAGALHRLFAYTLLPFILLYFFRQGAKAKTIFTILLAGAILTHPTTALYFVIIIALFSTWNIIEGLKREKTTIIKEQTPTIIGIVLAVGIATSYLGPVVIEQANGALNTPLYLLGSNSDSFGDGIQAPVATLTRYFGFTSKGQVYGYLGLGIIFLAIAGLIFSKNKIKKPILASALIFLTIAFTTNLIPAILQAVHYSRPLFMLSFLIAILAAFGAEVIVEKIGENKKTIQTTVTFAIIVFIILDLSAGTTAFSDGPFTKGITFNNIDQNNLSNVIEVNATMKSLIEQANPRGRVLISQFYFGHAWSTQTNHPHIQHSQESVNPEYNWFTYYLYQRREDTEMRGRMGMLNVNLFLGANQNQVNFNGLVFPATPAFKPNKTILIKAENAMEAQKVLEIIIAQPYFNYKKIGFILPTGNPIEQKADFILVSKKTNTREIDLSELEKIYNDTPEGKDIAVEQNGNEITVNANETGIIFVSQMWYPHFKYNDKQVAEAGGGLTAIYVDKSGPVAIYWEKPWYDYLFMAISALSLLAILSLYKTNEKHHLLGENKLEEAAR